MTKKRKAKTKRFRNEAEFDEHLDRAYDAFDQILELVSGFCREHLTKDYGDLCEDLTWAVYEEGLPLESGKPAGWASAIVHAVGWVNFLHDPSQSPHMTSLQLAQGFGVSQQTMMAKSKIIRDELDLVPLDPDWCTPVKLKDNPLVWMLKVNGVIMDIRAAPRGAQEEAYRLGLIPYIPADGPEPQPQREPQARIIQFPTGQNNTPAPESVQNQEGDEPLWFEEPQE